MPMFPTLKYIILFTNIIRIHILSNCFGAFGGRKSPQSFLKANPAFAKGFLR